MSHLIWPFGDVVVPLHEFLSADVQQPRRQLVPLPALKSLSRRKTLRLKVWEIWEAVVRSGVSATPTSLDALLLAVEGVARCARVLADDGQGGMVLRQAAYEGMRDAARNDSTGDLGQGFAWLLGIKVIGHREIVDFEVFCDSIPGVRAKIAKEKMPDFAGSADGWGTFDLLEAKGRTSRPPEWRRWLKGGLDQVAAGKTRLAGHRPHRGFAAALGLGFEGDTATELGFCDPTDPPPRDLPEPPRRRLSGAHYATWATTCGASRLSAGLLAGGQSFETEGVLFDLATGGASEPFFFPFCDVDLPWVAQGLSAPFFVGPSPAGVPIVRGIAVRTLRRALAGEPEAWRGLDDAVGAWPDSTVVVDLFSVLRGGSHFVLAA